MGLFSALVLSLAVHTVASYNFPVPSNTEDGKHLCFPTEVDGLPWPISSGWNLEQAASHGPHCLSLMLHPLSAIVDERHKKHCWDDVQEAMETLEQNPELRLPEIACEEIRKSLQHDFPSRDGGGRMRRSARLVSRRFSNFDYIAPINALTRSFFARKKRDVGDQVEANRQVYERVKALSKGPADLYVLLASYNSGQFFYLDKAEMTEVEKQYLKDWRRPKLSAIGMFCMVSDLEDPMQELRALMSSIQKHINV